MFGLVLAAIGAFGVYLLYTGAVMEHGGTHPASEAPRKRRSLRTWLDEAGLDAVSTSEFVLVSLGLAVAGAGGGFILFGSPMPALIAGAFASSFPAAAYRARRQARRAEAAEAWPRMIEEIRLLTGSLGRSIPQALLEVGRRGPDELRGAFEAAEREWLITTDFASTCEVLKSRLADPTADAACETLLVAHEVGGSDVDRRLAALVEDRIQDLQGRKDAQAKQAGVRFARRFVLIVPLGMAVAGLSIGTGRAAYQTGAGQFLVAVGLLAVALCWIWAGHLMKLPSEERVFR
ncbi:MAG TPA: hypothetical protein VM345_17010 [Acidimicrobiales bacterium]|jgi:tight adherence protein B|nr:hypothetical protein [Acidimicrobiales bacterium]